MKGIIYLSQGFLLTSMIFAAILVFMIDHKFLKAAWWCFAASMFSFVGLIHAYDLTEAGVQNKFGFLAAPEFGIVYALTGAILLILHFRRGQTRRG